LYWRPGFGASAQAELHEKESTMINIAVIACATLLQGTSSVESNTFSAEKLFTLANYNLPTTAIQLNSGEVTVHGKAQINLVRPDGFKVYFVDTTAPGKVFNATFTFEKGYSEGYVGYVNQYVPVTVTGKFVTAKNGYLEFVGTNLKWDRNTFDADELFTLANSNLADPATQLNSGEVTVHGKAQIYLVRPDGYRVYFVDTTAPGRVFTTIFTFEKGYSDGYVGYLNQSMPVTVKGKFVTAKNGYLEFVGTSLKQ